MPDKNEWIGCEWWEGSFVCDFSDMTKCPSWELSNVGAVCKYSDQDHFCECSKLCQESYKRFWQDHPIHEFIQDHCNGEWEPWGAADNDMTPEIHYSESCLYGPGTFECRPCESGEQQYCMGYKPDHEFEGCCAWEQVFHACFNPEMCGMAWEKQSREKHYWEEK